MPSPSEWSSFCSLQGGSPIPHPLVTSTINSATNHVRGRDGSGYEPLRTLETPGPQYFIITVTITHRPADLMLLGRTASGGKVAVLFSASFLGGWKSPLGSSLVSFHSLKGLGPGYNAASHTGNLWWPTVANAPYWQRKEWYTTKSTQTHKHKCKRNTL